jgi:hypothetical protein
MLAAAVAFGVVTGLDIGWVLGATGRSVAATAGASGGVGVVTATAGTTDAIAVAVAVAGAEAAGTALERAVGPLLECPAATTKMTPTTAIARAPPAPTVARDGRTQLVLVPTTGRPVVTGPGDPGPPADGTVRSGTVSGTVSRGAVVMGA